MPPGWKQFKKNQIRRWWFCLLVWVSDIDSEWAAFNSAINSASCSHWHHCTSHSLLSVQSKIDTELPALDQFFKQKPHCLKVFNIQEYVKFDPRVSLHIVNCKCHVQTPEIIIQACKSRLTASQIGHTLDFRQTQVKDGIGTPSGLPARSASSSEKYPMGWVMACGHMFTTLSRCILCVNCRTPYRLRSKISVRRTPWCPALNGDYCQDTSVGQAIFLFAQIGSLTFAKQWKSSHYLPYELPAKAIQLYSTLSEPGPFVTLNAECCFRRGQELHKTVALKTVSRSLLSNWVGYKCSPCIQKYVESSWQCHACNLPYSHWHKTSLEAGTGTNRTWII
jgi:hypothetical protein